MEAQKKKKKKRRRERAWWWKKASMPRAYTVDTRSRFRWTNPMTHPSRTKAIDSDDEDDARRRRNSSPWMLEQQWAWETKEGEDRRTHGGFPWGATWKWGMVDTRVGLPAGDEVK